MLKEIKSLIGIGIGSLIILVAGVMTVLLPFPIGTILWLLGWGVVYFSWVHK